MKLCYITDANSIHTRRWIEPFVEQGHNVHLLSYKPIHRSWKDVTLIDLTEITNVPKLRFLLWGWWVRQYVHRLQPDILHAHQVQAAGWLGAMANYHPFVVSGWGSDILVEPHKSAFRRYLFDTVLHRCDALTVPSQLLYDKASALGHSESQLYLMPWGIETDTFKSWPDDRSETRKRLGIEPKSKVLLCPRGISPLYNIDVFLKAVKDILPLFPNLRVVLLRFHMDSDYLVDLRQLISNSGLEDSVLWLPAQKSPLDMARLYRMADMTVSIPSSEGYGFTVYEAMACECPTVITDLPVFEKDLQHRIHTLKVSVGSVSETSEAIEDLLTDLSLRHSIVHRASQACKGRSVKERVEKSNALYRKLTDR